MKILALLAAAVLLTLTLVSFTGSSAQAACPYQGCAATKTTLTGPEVAYVRMKWVGPSGHRHRVVVSRPHVTYTVKVRTVGGNAHPAGSLDFSVAGATQRAAVGGGTRTFVTAALMRGTYTVRAWYAKTPGSAFSPSGATPITLVVRRVTVNAK